MLSYIIKTAFTQNCDEYLKIAFTQNCDEYLSKKGVTEIAIFGVNYICQFSGYGSWTTSLKLLNPYLVL